jgi:excisionase family DNA binding protein
LGIIKGRGVNFSIIIYPKEIENMEQKDPEWLTTKEVAKYLGISLSQVSWYMRQKPPPWTFYRVTATKRLTKRADLDAWLEKIKVSADATAQLVTNPALLPWKPKKKSRSEEVLVT